MASYLEVSYFLMKFVQNLLNFFFVWATIANLGGKGGSRGGDAKEEIIVIVLGTFGASIFMTNTTLFSNP